MTISKSQVLEIVYHAHGAAVEGVIGEGKCFSWGGDIINLGDSKGFLDLL